jgi:preprotein translocase subunit SecG
MNEKMKKTTAAYFIMFFVLIVVLSKPFTHASATSAIT